MGRTTRALLTAVTATSTVLLTAAPASAGEQTVQVNGQTRGYGGAGSDGLRVYACDTFSDNWGVRTHYTFKSSSGNLVTATIADANGVTTGCGEQSTSASAPVLTYRVCAGAAGADTGCTAWSRP
ncbi:hypothetical protein ACFWIA_15190 [Streptomyces sp. NPDC127068]|uniref:hypothetical protein n=1 Tax=Streptomyces sp. NPDC127068 TaxID=3347127 RepID=UPI003650A079